MRLLLKTPPLKIYGQKFFNSKLQQNLQNVSFPVNFQSDQESGQKDTSAVSIQFVIWDGFDISDTQLTNRLGDEAASQLPFNCKAQ